ncbi:Splicing factor 3B subunit 2 [Polyplax serrata]|uniref:Splicing factor 3B subunit 2 n=1 Tax=Polyplax serrata TaxID=468196 RepID=A0ABR1ANY4_POLSC
MEDDPESSQDGQNGTGLPSLLSMKLDVPPDVGSQELKLPQALEQALAFKSERAKEIGVSAEDEDDDNEDDDDEDDDGNNDAPPGEKVTKTKNLDSNNIEYEDDEAEDGNLISETKKDLIEQQSGKKETKNKRKKKRKKRRMEMNREKMENMKNEEKNQKDKENEVDVEVEYIQETLGLSELDPMYKEFAKIFDAFRIADMDKPTDAKTDATSTEERPRKAPKDDGTGDIDEEEDDEKKAEDGKPKLSKRKLKKLTRLSVAELKQLVNRPDVVEMHDVTARDPKLLVQLKAHRNTVPVPRHWCFKRKYLQGKRGIEKPPFDLPDFIKKTGIMEMRAALTEKEDQRTLKAKMRERARPKLGKIDIDYQKLHDAFFKWQTKPRMTIHGDLYYEGKEFETKLKEKKPGDLSDELRTALGMPVGPSAHKVPPPWLIAMQRYGPPPSYPNLKIPGLNAPIPEGCSFGYHAGGWGKPPVDESGKPLYGDVFGTLGTIATSEGEDEEVDRTMWGELESESEESDEEEEEEEEEQPKEDETGLVTPAEGLVTPSGITSIPAGLETPEIIELRKKKIESDMEGSEPPPLYQVLHEKRVERIGGSMMASTHIYEMNPTVPSSANAPLPPRRGAGGSAMVELALDPSELDLVDTDAMAVRYEQQIREQQSQLQKEDLSDMVVEHVSRQKNKRKRAQIQETKPTKKYKEFRF